MILLESKIILLTWPGLHRRTCGLAKCWRHGMLIATGCVLPLSLGVDWQFTSVLRLANNAPASAGVNRRARSRWCGVAWGADLSRQKTFDDRFDAFKMGEAETKRIGWCWMCHGHHSLTAWQLAWSVLIQIMLPNLRLGGLCEPDLNQGGNCQIQRTFRTFRTWSMKLLQSWKMLKGWQNMRSSEGLSKMQTAWPLHLQMAPTHAVGKACFLSKDSELCRNLTFQYVGVLKDSLQNDPTPTLSVFTRQLFWPLPQRRRQGQCHEENSAATKRCLEVLQTCWIFPGVSSIASWCLVWSLVQCVSHIKWKLSTWKVLPRMW